MSTQPAARQLEVRNGQPLEVGDNFKIFTGSPFATRPCLDRKYAAVHHVVVQICTSARPLYAEITLGDWSPHLVRRAIDFFTKSRGWKVKTRLIENKTVLLVWRKT